MGSQLLDMVAREIFDGLWSELANLVGLWLHLVSWLLAENGRALAFSSAPLVPWLVLLLIAGRALLPTFTREQRQTRRLTGGTE